MFSRGVWTQLANFPCFIGHAHESSLALQGVVTYTLPVEAFATGIKNVNC